MPSPSYLLFAAFASFAGFAASVTILILALVWTRHRGRTLVVTGAAVLLTGNVLGEMAQGSANLMSSFAMAADVLPVVQTVGVVANLMVGAGVLLLAGGLVGSRRGRQQPPQAPFQAGHTFPPPTPGPYPPQWWPPGPGMPGHDEGRGPR